MNDKIKNDITLSYKVRLPSIWSACPRKTNNLSVLFSRLPCLSNEGIDASEITRMLFDEQLEITITNIMLGPDKKVDTSINVDTLLPYDAEHVVPNTVIDEKKHGGFMVISYTIPDDQFTCQFLSINIDNVLDPTDMINILHSEETINLCNWLIDPNTVSYKNINSLSVTLQL